MHAFITLGLTIIQILSMLLTIYFWIIIVAAVISWIEPNPYNPIVRAIYAITEPVFDFFRERLPLVFGGIDCSPILVIIVIYLIQRWLLPELQYALITGAL